MSAVAIVRGLLAANAALVALVPDTTSIFSGVIPESSPVPCIGVLEVVTTEIPHIDATAPTTLVEGHAQVTVVTKSYVVLKQILALARKACNYQRGVINGFTVVSVRRLANGPEFVDVEAKFYMQTIDFSVIYYEPN